MIKKVFELIFEADNQGVEAISLVDKPAIEIEWITLNSEKPFYFLNEEKMELVGPALIPNKEIIRYDGNNEPYFIFFSEETIKKIQEKYMKENKLTKINFDHDNEKKNNNVYITESWLIEDEFDKSKKFNFNLPIGTWMIKMKVDDLNVWKEIKEGKYNGFSIECLLSMKDLNNKLNEKNIKNMKDVKKDVKLEDAPVIEDTPKVDESTKNEDSSDLAKRVDDLENTVIDMAIRLEKMEGEIATLMSSNQDLNAENENLKKLSIEVPTEKIEKVELSSTGPKISDKLSSFIKIRESLKK